MMNDYKTVDGDDILSNSIRAIKQYIPRKIEEVEKHAPTGDKSTPQYQLDAAYNLGYKKALEDLATFIKAMGV
jgi:hypothetical protein